MDVIVAVLSAGVIMGILDFVWLGFVAKKIYYDEMGKMLRDKPNMVAALLFYVIYVAGVVCFVVSPALKNDSLVNAVLFGAFFGLVAYATYDLTNLATMKSFSRKIVVIDLIWGACITAAMSVGAFIITNWLT